MKICDIKCDGVEVEITDAGGCQKHRRGDKTKLADSTPDGLCSHAYHVVYPYVLTLQNRGWFTWVRRDDGVIVQCPHPKGLIMKVRLNKRRLPEVNVEAVKARECPLHKEGDVFTVDDSVKLCPRLFDVAYAGTRACTKPPKKPVKFYCPNADGVVFELRPD